MTVGFRLRTEGGRLLPFILGLVLGAVLVLSGQGILSLIRPGG